MMYMIFDMLSEFGFGYEDCETEVNFWNTGETTSVQGWFNVADKTGMVRICSDNELELKLIHMSSDWQWDYSWWLAEFDGLSHLLKILVEIEDKINVN